MKTFSHNRVSALACALAIIGLIAAPISTLAWGPHPQITSAATDTLEADHPFRTILGVNVKNMPQYCWMGDWRGQIKKAGSGSFYANDFLLYPEFPRHANHICPDVENTYTPYFLRALQAMEMESPENAARWIGAILHFVEDTGSPPHSARVTGPMHTKGENWIKGELIHIKGYQPQLLGESPNAAAQGLERRMAGLIAFSKLRYERAKPFLESEEREKAEPIILESALETSRVVADMFHSLGVLAARSTRTGGTIAGTFRSINTGVARAIPAKIVIMGTTYSTLAGPDGQYVLRGVPAGDYELRIFALGKETAHSRISVIEGKTTNLSDMFTLGGLLRNADFQSEWAKKGQPDHWQKRKNNWEGEWVSLIDGQSYSISVEWKLGKSAEVKVEFAPSMQYGVPKTLSKALTPENPQTTFSGSTRFAYARIIAYTVEPPSDHWEKINFEATDTP